MPSLPIRPDIVGKNGTKRQSGALGFLVRTFML